MLFIQQNMDDSTAYKAGYETGKFIAQNPVLSTIIGIVLFVALIYLFIKIIKKLRTFGE